MATLTKPCAFIALSMLLAACSSDEPANGPTVKYETVPTIELSRSEASSNDGLNSFGMKFFNEIAKSDDPEIGHNFVVSPTSMALCVSMIANACDRPTSQSIIDLMGCENLSDLNSLSKKLMQFLPDKSNKAELGLANSVWYRNDMVPSDDFKNRISGYYFGEIAGVDFASVDATGRINRWCRENTANVIEEAFEGFPKDTRLVCLNTLYFKGGWNEHFDTKETHEQTFHGAVADAEVEMMHNQLNLLYSESEKWESVSIPYEGTNSMIVFLPKDSDGINELAATISDNDIAAATKMAQTARVNLAMPKFSSQSAPDLTAELQQLGVSCAPADLEGFSGSVSEDPTELAILFRQNTIISTDETGTVAASVSAGIVTDTAVMPGKVIDFTLDRPFIYVIRNSKTGSILIAGRYAQPQ